MTWRTGTKNPHTLYLDEGDVSLPQGFIMNPGAARAIVEAMNAFDEGRKFWDHVDSGHPAIEREKETLELLREARDELRIWLRQLHGMAPRDATQDAMRLTPILLAIELRLREPKSGKLEREMAKLGLHHMGESAADVKRRMEP